MAIPQRHSHPNNIVSNERTFFVTACTWGKRALFQSDRAADLLVRTLLDYGSQGKFRLHEYVIMPNHIHALLTVGRETTIERAMQFIKGGFAYRARKELEFRAPVWQKGFSEVRVLDDAAYQNQREYIHKNPVAAHIVLRPEQYRYSSAAPGTLLDPKPQRLKPRLGAYLIGTPEGVS